MNHKSEKERILENYLRYFETYKVAIRNCEQQLEYIMPSLVAKVGIEVDDHSTFIPNDTEKVAVNRIEGKKAINLQNEIEKFNLIISSINNALEDLTEQEKEFVAYRYFDRLEMSVVKKMMGYSEEKSIYRIRRSLLDKLMISLKNLLTLT